MEKMSMKKTYAVVVCAVTILVAISFSVSYSYFTSDIATGGQETSTNVTTTELQDIVLSGQTDVTADNLIPGKSITNTFKISNPNNKPVPYKLVWSDVVNNFVNQSDLIVTLSADGLSDFTPVSFPATGANTVLLDGKTIDASTTLTFTLKIEYKNTDKNQFADMGQTINLQD